MLRIDVRIDVTSLWPRTTTAGTENKQEQSSLRKGWVKYAAAVRFETTFRFHLPLDICHYAS